MWWTEEDISAFEASEDDYRKKLEQIKLQKKDIRDKLKAVVRCLERDGSLKEAELELRIPVDELDDITEMYKVEVPENPYRVQEVEMIAVPVAEMDILYTYGVRQVIVDHIRHHNRCIVLKAGKLIKV